MGDLARTETPEERFNRLVSEPGFLEAFCECIALGDSIQILATMYGVSHASLWKWVHAQGYRLTAYNQATEIASARVKDNVIMTLSQVASSDIRNIFDPDGKIKPIDEWTPETAAFVSSIKVLEKFDNMGNKIGELKEVKLWDKLKAVELLGKTQRMFTDQIEHSGRVSLEDLIVNGGK